MADGAGFKERARAYEQRENWKRAIEEYELAIQADRTSRREADLAVYNRVGDLYRRIGNINKAVHFYELAADGHLAAGFYNNAIALCNKILRNQPNRHSAYLKLGKIGAAKGFLSDARKHFLEYAERMKRASQLNDAFAALIEFADLSPDPEVRLMIADQLIGHQREGLAVEQLRLAWRDLVQDGREADAQQVRERILDLAPDRDPEVDPPEDATTAVETDALGILDLPEILPFEELPADRGAKAKPKPRARDEAPVAELDFLEEPTEATVDAAAEAPEAAVVADERPLMDDIMGIESDTAAGVEIETEDLELDGSGYTVEGLEDSEVEVEDAALEIIPTSLVPGEEPLVIEGAEDLNIEPTQLAADTDYGVSTEATAEEVGVAGLEPPLVDETVELLDVSPADQPLELEGAMDLEVVEPVVEATVAGPEQRVADLEGRLRSERRTPELLVELAEARLELDEREQASADLREALELYEEWGQYSDAKTVLDELLRLDVNDVRAYQKGVELALRAEDRGGLVNAYLALADCLQRVDASEKARIVYRRVMELDPGNTRAEAALEIFGEEEPRPARPAAVAPRGRAAQAAPGEYVNLAELVREEEEVKARSTRFRLPTPDPQSEDEVNFSEMLSQFKSMVSEAIDEQDSSSHYDLGVAYKEMGLLDEAIAEFQVAARDLTYRLRAIEMLGTCFSEKGDHRIALKVLKRAEQTRDYRDEDLIGILYAMGRAHEELGEKASALECYERVIGCQVSFRDAARRVRALRQ